MLWRGIRETNDSIASRPNLLHVGRLRSATHWRQSLAHVEALHSTNPHHAPHTRHGLRSRTKRIRFLEHASLSPVLSKPRTSSDTHRKNCRRGSPRVSRACRMAIRNHVARSDQLRHVAIRRYLPRTNLHRNAVLQRQLPSEPNWSSVLQTRRLLAIASSSAAGFILKLWVTVEKVSRDFAQAHSKRHAQCESCDTPRGSNHIPSPWTLPDERHQGFGTTGYG